MRGENGSPETPDWTLVAVDRASEVLAAIGERAAQRHTSRAGYDDPPNITRGEN